MSLPIIRIALSMGNSRIFIHKRGAHRRTIRFVG